MLSLLQLLALNHRIISRGKMTGFMGIEGKRADGYWF
jgi:hypothetical protein